MWNRQRPILEAAQGGIAAETGLLRVSLSGEAGAAATLHSADSLSIGRDAACGLRIEDPGIEPRHAEIYRLGAVWWVRDLGSDGGTFLDEDLIDAAPLDGVASLQLGAAGPILRLEPS